MGMMGGVMGKLFNLAFGPGQGTIKEAIEVFRVNAEAEAQRDFGLRDAALQQFAAEFLAKRRSRFDIFMDAMNRVPRPAMALGTLGLFVAAMVDPVWFAARMAGIALVPEPLWWLLAAIVSFYFGARHQAKGQEYRQQMVNTMASVPQVLGQVRDLDALRERASADQAEPVRTAGAEVTEIGAGGAENPALAEWRAAQR